MYCTSITHYMMWNMTVKLPHIRPYFSYSVLCYKTTTNTTVILQNLFWVQGQDIFSYHTCFLCHRHIRCVKGRNQKCWEFMWLWTLLVINVCVFCDILIKCVLIVVILYISFYLYHINITECFVTMVTIWLVTWSNMTSNFLFLHLWQIYVLNTLISQFISYL